MGKNGVLSKRAELPKQFGKWTGFFWQEWIKHPYVPVLPLWAWWTLGTWYQIPIFSDLCKWEGSISKHISCRNRWKLNQRNVLHTYWLWPQATPIYSFSHVVSSQVFGGKRCRGLSTHSGYALSIHILHPFLNFSLRSKDFRDLIMLSLSDTLQGNVINVLKKFVHMEILKMNCFQVLGCSTLKVTENLSYIY